MPCAFCVSVGIAVITQRRSSAERVVPPKRIVHCSSNPGGGATFRIHVVLASAFSVLGSCSRPIVYRSGSAVQQQFVWVDRSGKRIEEVGGPDSLGAEGTSSLSPDGRRVALFRTVDGNSDIWLLELGRNVPSRFTTDAAAEVLPTWSPDGTRVVFSSNRNGAFDLYEKPAAGAGTEESLLTTAQTKFASDWSPAGAFSSIAALTRRGQTLTSGLSREMENKNPFRLSRRTSSKGSRDSLPTESGLPTSRTSPAVSKSISNHFPALELRC